ncbi:phytanoyl-CoA dioxygenase family protein [Paenibacillus sepulcri]|uniref:Phytanoyl-CoA dioxygenase family protein n=1 Tax=Paenibacillus sepulcri TaxID=359917 RepID=A0ABS7C5G0_9BACL|nr:phytanoyl-CoA dioxygenase family protein [Paenibacillus sepulcri]
MASVDPGRTVSITDEQMKQYEEKGFIIFDQLFSGYEMDEIRGIIDELDAESEKALLEKGQDFINVAGKINFNGNINFLRPELQRFTADQRFVDITTTILGPDTKLYWDQSVYKRPEADKDFPWHQDNGYVPTDPVHYVTCWLALDDATIENGCIWIQPGTHKKGFVPHIKTDLGWICYYGDIEGEPVELKKGSMVVFHSLLFHRSRPNLSSATRKAYVIQYSVDGAKNPKTGHVFNNGPLIAKGGKSVYTGFVPREHC